MNNFLIKNTINETIEECFESENNEDVKSIPTINLGNITFHPLTLFGKGLIVAIAVVELP
ncbi:MAG: hypothetical protein OEL81_05430 [Nitrosopumilus sp.]|nr:hypothetical protein [Nitrosopumilus sp.]MDH3764294.1 hypothetical protein [Nitrosopumilus sp.]